MEPTSHAAKDVIMPLMPKARRFHAIPFGVLAVLAVVLAGCADGQDAIALLSQKYKNVPSYSIVLDDMREEGNFFKHYFHKYKIVVPESAAVEGWPAVEGEAAQETTTDWMEVSSDFFEYSLPFLGMTLYTKKDGQEFEAAGPPGYEYVGDSRYGAWRTDSSGGSFWEFYGKYALLSHLLGSGPIYRNHWDDYNRFRAEKKPYYGPNQQYGTNGAHTQAQKPDFFSRRQAKDLAQKSSFAKKVDQRVGRTKSSLRSRGGGGSGK